MRVARLAYAYRQRFHKDVVIDMVSYRRYGHNEGDDPSYTQPLMYAKIDERRSVRKLFTESLVKRGQLTLDEAEQALDDFQTQAAAGARRDPPVRPAVQPAGRRAAAADRCACRRSRPASTGPCSTASTTRWAAGPTTSTSTPSWPSSSTARDTMVREDGEVDWALGRGPGLRLAARSRAPTSASPARTRGAARSASATPCWSTTTTGARVRAARAPRSGAGQVLDLRLAAVRVRGARASSTATRSPTRTRWCAGRRSSATSSTARSSIIDQFLVAAEDKWDQTSRPGAAAAPRVRGPGARAQLRRASSGS